MPSNELQPSKMILIPNISQSKTSRQINFDNSIGSFKENDSLNRKTTSVRKQFINNQQKVTEPLRQLPTIQNTKIMPSNPNETITTYNIFVNSTEINETQRSPVNLIAPLFTPPDSAKTSSLTELQLKINEIISNFAESPQSELIKNQIKRAASPERIVSIINLNSSTLVDSNIKVKSPLIKPTQIKTESISFQVEPLADVTWLSPKKLKKIECSAEERNSFSDLNTKSEGLNRNFDLKNENHESISSDSAKGSSIVDSYEDVNEWNIGEIAWARMATYPFWPCIVSWTPDGEYINNFKGI